jgi:methionyl-tRNA synthetase
MVERLRFFRESDMRTECETCGNRFDLMKGGICERCRRILCERHLHGSWVRRMIADVRGTNVCVECRGQARP